MSRGSLAFLAVKAVLLAAILAFASPEHGPQLFVLGILVLTLAGAMALCRRCG